MDKTAAAAIDQQETHQKPLYYRYAKNPLDTFSRNFPTSPWTGKLPTCCGLVGDSSQRGSRQLDTDLLRGNWCNGFGLYSVWRVHINESPVLTRISSYKFKDTNTIVLTSTCSTELNESNNNNNIIIKIKVG